MLKSDLIIAGSNFIFSHINENYSEYLNSKKKFLVIFRGINTDYFDNSTTLDSDEDKLLKNWNIKRGDKPVHWCVDCGSSLAEAEVEYQDKISTSIDFIFPIENDLISNIFENLTNNKSYVASWTTTPWTLPGNLALTINE